MERSRLGIGTIPRYGGGWMHQFGHIYALQKEMLNPKANDWLHAIELWHTARHEGLALNSAHYTNILRQCVQPAQWEPALWVLRQMRRDAIRPDVVGVGCAIATCAEAGKWESAMEILRYYTSTAKMLLDSTCFHGAARACNKCGKHDVSLKEVFVLQERDRVPFLPPNYMAYLEACDECGDDVLALQLVRRMTQTDQYWLPAKQAQRVRRLCERSGTLRQCDDLFLECQIPLQLETHEQPLTPTAIDG